MNAPANPQRMNLDRRLYVGAAIAVAVIIVAGFAPNYILRMLHDRRDMTWLVQLHGLVMVSFIALFLTQTILVAKHRVDLHRRLGIFGVVLIGLILLLGIPVLVNAAARQAHDTHSTQFLLMLVAFDGVGLLTFAGLAVCAVLLRRHSDFHKRLMLLATLSLLGPAFGRLDTYINGFRYENPVAILLAMLACVFVCVGVDTFRHRRVHPAFVWGTAVAVATDLVTYSAKALLS